jgi:hypothetical protein
LIDARHAAMAEQVVRELFRLGWEVRVEYTFNVRGERGSVDVLAWFPSRRALLVIEVKTQVVDVQDLLSTLDRKRRIVPGVVAGDLGWNAAYVGCLVVLPEETRARDAVVRHAAVFASTMPARNIGIRRWLVAPNGAISGLMFLRYSSTSNGRRGWGAPTRVWRPTVAPAAARPRSAVGVGAVVAPAGSHRDRSSPTQHY